MSISIWAHRSLKNLTTPARVKMSGLARREALWGLIFLSPWIIGFLAWYLLPMAASLLFSFTNFQLLHPEELQWVGFGNYVKLFNDPVAITSAKVSLRFALIALPVSIVQPIAMAALLNSRRLWLKRLFTTLFFMPAIVPLVSGVYIWQGFLNNQTGWLNRALRLVGAAGPDWLNDVTWIYPALVIIGLWGAGNAMVVTLAGMQGVPTELYEAARVDGAGAVTSFFHITVPMITPVIFYNLILSLIGIFQYFLIPFILSNGTGRPGNATLFYAMQLYRTAFTYSDMGLGAAMAWALFVAVMTATAVLFGTSRYWVYYAGGEAR